MATEQEWSEAFKRLERGSSLRQEAAKLDTSKSTVERRFSNYIERRTKELRTNLAGLISEVSKAEKGLTGLRQEYAHRERLGKAKLEEQKQREEAKLREILMKQEQEGKRRLKKIDAELEAKKRLMPECVGRGLTLEQCLEAVKRIADLGGEISRRKKIAGQWKEAIFERQKRSDELDRQNKEKEGHLGYLTTKLRLSEQILQRRQAEDQQLQENIFRQSAWFNQLSGQVKELWDTKVNLDVAVKEREKRNKTLERDGISLEKRDAWLRKSNAELESKLKMYTLKIGEVKAAEAKREAQLDTEFDKKKKEINEDIERRIEESEMIVEKEVRKIAEESAKRVSILKQRELDEKLGWKKQPVHDARGKIVGYVMPVGP